MANWNLQRCIYSIFTSVPYTPSCAIGRDDVTKALPVKLERHLKAAKILLLNFAVNSQKNSHNSGKKIS